MRTFLVFLAAVFLFSCVPRKNNNRFDDPHAIRIGEFQDRRQTDSLLSFLNHVNPVYRQWACDALASVQDTVASAALGNLMLEDADPSVRSAAAFALGQTSGYQAVNGLIPALTDTNPAVRREALEALGKTIRKEDLSSLKDFIPRDSADEEGLAWALYRVGVRNLLDTVLVKKAMELLDVSKSYSVQLGVAHTFARTTYPLLHEVQTRLTTATTSKWPEIRMTAGYALRKFVNQESLAILSALIRTDLDYRVRVNATRSLRFFDWELTESIYPISLKDSSALVSIAAAEVIRDIAQKGDTEVILAWTKEVKNKRAQAHLYEGIMTVQPTAEFTNELIGHYNQSTDEYEKSWLLNALSKSPWTVDFLTKEMLTSSAMVIKSGAAAALVELNKQPDFNKNQRAAFASSYQKAIVDGDVGVIISVCEALKDPSLGYRDVIKDTQFLKETRQKLSLPRDFEAVQPLEETIAYFEGRDFTPVAKEFNHPINWDSVKAIPSDQRVVIKTTKGDIEIALLVDEAPGSVLNFIQLVNQHYFDGKYIHRVVPNFVVQAGCKRGDGFGSEDYSIRSEFTRRRYSTGSVGMASAGKDTEGTQWFITHSPTPHLDGGYTLFAEVVKGMDVVHQVEVGDQIITASLIRN